MDFTKVLLLVLTASSKIISALPVGDSSIDTVAPNANITRDIADVKRATFARKRGVSYNGSQYPKMFNVPGNQIAWIYNWWQLPEGPGQAPVDTPFWEYIPMLHSDHPDHTSTWFANVDKCAGVNPAGAIHVLSFNEPDQCGNGGSCMRDFVQAAESHKQWVQPLVDKYGPPPDRGPMGLPWLREFLRHCDGCKFDYVVIHWYDSSWNVDYFKKQLQDAWDEFQKPVWITEFGPTGSVDDHIRFLSEVLPWMDETPWVFRYAMQMAEPGKLIADDGQGLSTLGYFYAAS